MSLIPRYTLTHPGNVGIYGKTQSGKTTLMANIIKYNTVMVQDKHNNPVTYNSIWIFHGAVFQPLYDELQSTVDSLIFYKGFPTKPIEDVIKQEQRPALVFIDDQEELLRDSGGNRLKNLVNKDCHHLDMLVIMSFQSLFPRGNESVNIQRQFDVYVFMAFAGNHNIRMKLDKILADKRMARLMSKVWSKWIEKRGGYMLIDLHLDKLAEHEKILAWTKIFPNDQFSEDLPRVLVKK